MRAKDELSISGFRSTFPLANDVLGILEAQIQLMQLKLPVEVNRIFVVLEVCAFPRSMG